jgi:hypothetical protein
MEKYIIILVILATIYYIQSKLLIEDFADVPAQSLGGVDDTNAINTLAQISKQLMAGGITVPGNIIVEGDLVFPKPTTIKGAGRLHIGGEELLYILNKAGVMIGKEWGGNGNLTVQGNVNIGADLIFPNQTTIKGAGRLHIGGEELLYILNKAGVMIGKEWGGNGNLNVQGDLIVQGRNILAELNDLRGNAVRRDQQYFITAGLRREGSNYFAGENLIVHGDRNVATWPHAHQQTMFKFLQA